MPPRFWSKVDRSGDCWLWTGRVVKSTGTRQFDITGRPKRIRMEARRVAWKLEGRKLADDQLLLATCGQRLCVRPSHMKAGTQADLDRWSDENRREMFWSHVDQTTEGCWEWKASRFPNGYGQAHLNGLGTGAHRVSWTLTNGEIPPGMAVCHHCDNPPCVRPDHLFLGSPQENTADMITKGRYRAPRRTMAKMTDEQVRLAREAYFAGGTTFAKLAAANGVTTMAMFNAVKGNTYQHVS